MRIGRRLMWVLRPMFQKSARWRRCAGLRSRPYRLRHRRSRDNSRRRHRRRPGSRSQCRAGAALGSAAAAAGGRPGREVRRSRRHATRPISRRRRVRHRGQFLVRRDRQRLDFLPAPDGKLVPVVNCNPPPEIGQTCEPQGTRWHDGKLYLTTRHRGILVYDPQTKELKTLVYTYRNQLFKGPNDLDFDAEGNLFFTDPWATGVGPNLTDQSGAVYQYSKDGILRKIIDDLNFPNGIAVSPDNARLAIGDCTASRMVYAIFATGPTLSTPGAKPDPLHLTFQTVRAATYLPGSGCPDGLHYDVKGNLWISAAGLGGILQVDPRGIILGFVAIPNGDLSTTNLRSAAPTTRRSPSWAPTAAHSGGSQRPIRG